MLGTQEAFDKCELLLSLLSAFSPLPKCRPKYIASKSGLPRMALLPTYQMSLEMRLSDYILRFPGEIKEPPNSYIQIQREIKSHSILEEKQNRGHPWRRRENIWNVLIEQ